MKSYEFDFHSIKYLMYKIQQKKIINGYPDLEVHLL
jgi:hypothetical protein